jgi:hypothetical protein
VGAAANHGSHPPASFVWEAQVGGTARPCTCTREHVTGEGGSVQARPPGQCVTSRLVAPRPYHTSPPTNHHQPPTTTTTYHRLPPPPTTTTHQPPTTTTHQPPTNHHHQLPPPTTTTNHHHQPPPPPPRLRDRRCALTLESQYTSSTTSKRLVSQANNRPSAPLEKNIPLSQGYQHTAVTAAPWFTPPRYALQRTPKASKTKHSKHCAVPLCEGPTHDGLPQVAIPRL